ncbi:AraC family transcriptional regulator [Aquimarina sp. 2201CG5-10]|uniref:helix-turn-helix domain-containing protein n=1 Tax=Aquimarina callyspongiae TaxID=3098150 RepID=UPI002AB343D1|nr:AraC family transcriptional regulator [Aquimarina sp. 2201CG5-10]MDY8136993.1 AraC family transcriptional regulator [Aquimarina sp. 2201CG5-10]
MEPFEFIDLILFLGISQGIFLAITLQIIKNKNKTANRILGIILLLASFMLLGRMLFLKYITVRLFQVSILVDSIIFIFGPLCLMYLRRLAYAGNKNFKLQWFHYLPVIIHLLFFGYVISLSQDEFVLKLNDKHFSTPFLLIEGLGVISNIYYWTINTRLILWYSKEEKQNISYKQNLTFFLKFFQISVGLFLALWVLSFVSVNFFNRSLYPIGYNWVWIGISVFIFVIGYYSLKEPELFRIPIQMKSKDINRLPESEIFSLGNRLKYIMEKEKLFLQSDLTLRDLSEKLDTSTHNISWYLNKVLHSSFYDYINHYRIKEFLQKIENNEHAYHTILAIAMDVGFNSKSTFNKAFKQEMNDTPSNYIKQLKIA